MKKMFAFILLFCATTTHAQNLAISIGIRENNDPVGTFNDGGGGGNGIEWVRRDQQSLVLDGTWQQFTFTPGTDLLTAFAGSTANSVLEAGHEWSVLEHIRMLNVDGITQPIRVWLDNVTNTVAAVPTVQGFEAFANSAEVMFREPSFSGSTFGNLTGTSAAGVTDSMAFAGDKSYQFDFNFVDNDPTRWVRLTTFEATNVPNPAIRVRLPGGPAPTVSFYLKGTLVPEPSALVLASLTSMALLALRRRA